MKHLTPTSVAFYIFLLLWSWQRGGDEETSSPDEIMLTRHTKEPSMLLEHPTKDTSNLSSHYSNIHTHVFSLCAIICCHKQNYSLVDAKSWFVEIFCFVSLGHCCRSVLDNNSVNTTVCHPPTHRVVCVLSVSSRGTECANAQTKMRAVVWAPVCSEETTLLYTKMHSLAVVCAHTPSPAAPECGAEGL